MLIRFYKPYGVLCQFRDAALRPCLGDYIDQPGVYAAGRLDMDSEGLLLLTDDGALQARISHPRFKLRKTYQVQVEARPDMNAFAAIARELCDGVLLGDGIAHAVSVRQIDAPALPPREPAVTPHRAGRSSWVEVVLTEGRNRQVRRMLAAVGMPVLRLVRVAIGAIDLAGLAPGQWDRTAIPVAPGPADLEAPGPGAASPAIRRAARSGNPAAVRRPGKHRTRPRPAPDRRR
jgi:23S rRNA pseudouridine2457 synthase